MPPYSLEMPASFFIASKLASPPGKRYASTAAAAAEKVECPEVYEGKFGRPIEGLMLRSSWEGRGLKYAYLASQQPTAASCIAMFSNAKTRAASTSLKRASRTCS